MSDHLLIILQSITVKKDCWSEWVSILLTVHQHSIILAVKNNNGKNTQNTFINT